MSDAMSVLVDLRNGMYLGLKLHPLIWNIECKKLILSEITIIISFFKLECHYDGSANKEADRLVKKVST